MFETGFFVFVVFALGAAIGSFLHVVAERYGSQKSPFSGRSFCPHCNKTLTALEMIPIISYTLSGARCRGCNVEIPAHYPSIELLSGILATLLLVPIVLQAGTLFLSVLLFISACILVILIRIDSRTMLLPDGYLYILTGVVLVYGLFVQKEISDSIFGVLVGAGALYLLWIGTAGRGIGFGDVKLMIPLGILFGVHGTIALLFFSFCAGGLVSIFLLATKQVTPKTAIPFGPFLAGSALILLAFPLSSDLFFAFLGVY